MESMTDSTGSNKPHLLSKDDCIGLSKFYQDVLYKIILGIGAANVTLVGFGFKEQTSFYFFIAFVLLMVCIIVFRYVKKTIAYLYLTILSMDPEDYVSRRYVSMFLRCDRKELNDAVQAFSSKDTTEDKVKLIANKLANPKWFPRYFDGIYPCLWMVTLITLILFVITIFIW